jgi:hydrogenase nickel incorporation protein HypA/HybF
MHETTLIAQLLRRVEQVAREAGAERVTAVRLKAGEFAGAHPRLLESAFDQLKVGTLAEDAQLDIEAVPLELFCDPCGRRFAVEHFRFRCPKCGNTKTQVVAGEDLILESLSIATRQDPCETVLA